MMDHHHHHLQIRFSHPGGEGGGGRRNELDSHEIRARFDVDQVLGKGAFATVYRARRLIGRRSKSVLNSCTRRSYNHSFLQPQQQLDGQDHDEETTTQRSNDDDYHHNQYVCLKIVNVTKVSERRREHSSSLPADSDDGNNDDKENGLSELVSHHDAEYDTEQLFFPSRIRNNYDCDHNKDHTGTNKKKDDEEFIQSKKLLQREISVHLNVSKSNHPNIVSMLETFEYNIVGRTNERNLIMGMVIEYCPLGDLHQYLKRIRSCRRREEWTYNNHNNTNQQSLSKTFIDEKEIKYAMRQILRGLAFLHSRGIVHRDIKAANIFLTKSTTATTVSGIWMDDEQENKKNVINSNYSAGNPVNFTLKDCCLKIGDFGLAVQMSDDDDWDDAQHTLCGTPSCLAPEVVLSSPAPKSREGNNMFQPGHDSLLSKFQNKDEFGTDVRGHGQPADLWSVGCILYVMLFGRYPFSSSNRNIPNEMNIAENRPPIPNKLMKIKGTIQNVVKGNWSVPQNCQVQDTSINLLSQLLSHDPSCRGFARGILSSHAFFRETNNMRMPMESYRNTKINTSRIVKKPTTESSPTLNYLKEKTNSLNLIPQKREVSTRKNEFHHQIVDNSMLLKSHSTLFQDQVKASKKRSNRTSHSKKQQQLKALLSPLNELHRLPAMKHHWKIEKCSQSSSETKQIHFTLFVLPDHKGIVFQCEKIGGSGIWMHLLKGGKRISMGKLSKYSRIDNHDRVFNEGETTSNIIKEAFSRQPLKLRYGNQLRADFGVNIGTKRHRGGKNENQSMCTIGQGDFTTFSSQSMNSMPISIHHAKSKKDYFKRLSSLLRDKNKSYLVVYRTLEKFGRRFKRRLPKIHLSIYSKYFINHLDKSNDHLLCILTITEAENGDVISVHFVDGTRIYYDRSNGHTQLVMSGKDGKSSDDVIQFNMNKNDSLSQLDQHFSSTKDNDQAIKSYVQFARSAIRKGIELESEDNMNVEGAHSMNPHLSRLIVVKGKSYKSWVDVTDNSVNIHTRKLFTRHLLNRCLNYDHETDLSHPLEAQFRT